MKKTSATTIFLFVLAVWALVAAVVALSSGRLLVLAALPVAAILVGAARAERLTQAAQLVWPVLMLPGATFVFIGFMQSMGYGRMNDEPEVTLAALRITFFGTGLLLHLAAFALLANEPRARDHPGGEIAQRMP